MILQEKIQKKAEGFGETCSVFLEGAMFAPRNQRISLTTKGVGDKNMTTEEYSRLVAKIAILKEVAEEYSGKTIDNIIVQMESRKKEVENAN